jgi:uncharacterized protein (TIGR02588 family)
MIKKQSTAKKTTLLKKDERMATRHDNQPTSAQDQQPKGSRKSSQQGQQETPFSEMVIGVLGLLLVLATIGYLLYQGFQVQDSPEIVLEVDSVIAQETGYLVEITVTNQGGQTAAGLVVTGNLLPKQTSGDSASSNDQPVESEQVTFDFVPPRSYRQGGLIFSYNPLDYDLELNAGGYTKP